MTQTQSIRSNASVDNSHITQGIMNNGTLELKTFEYTDHNALDLEHEIEQQFFLFHQQQLPLLYWGAVQLEH
jgi:hypothetical protein